ncbi:MAG: ComEA family DNA-binding protein [bacterium]|nr:ComEA family DNA-binding protein [bacterium]
MLNRFWFRREEQVVTLFLIVILVGINAGLFIKREGINGMFRKNRSCRFVNINEANDIELQTLPGISKHLAKRIIDHRKKNGNFQTREEIIEVKGIGEKTFAKISHLITVK